MDTQRYKSALIFLFMMMVIAGWQATARAAEFCSDTYHIDVTLPNGARWDMCWEHRNREGIVLHKIHYTPYQGTRQMILNEAALAQIHVPYDDNGARYHDISDYGLGSNYMSALSQNDCPGGQLLTFGGKNVICQQQAARGSSFAYGDDSLQGDALSLFSVSRVGAYNYIPFWRFVDDGSIEPGIGATGALQRFGNSGLESHGWLVDEDKVGIAHLHNFFWRLDFDLGATGNNDYVEELNFTQANGKTSLSTTRFDTERARRVDPAQLRSWRIVDGELKNGKGLPMSYEIRLQQAEQQDTGPDSEPFTRNDLYVTRYKACELFASHNPTANGCASNLAAFVSAENIQNQDIIVWPSTTFYHIPRSEDTPRMDAHWSHISITPRDWHDSNPLSTASDTSGSSPAGNTPTPGSGSGSGGSTNTGSGSGTTTGNPPVSTAPLYQEDFESASNWTRNPHNTDTAQSGLWASGQPEATTYQAVSLQRAASSGSHAMVTGPRAGATVGSGDIDGGVTSIRSPLIQLPAGSAYTLTLDYYFAHLWNASNADFLRISTEQANGTRQILLEKRADLSNKPAQWNHLTADLSALAGKQIHLLLEAADGGSGSIVEAAVDHILITPAAGNSGDNASTGNNPPGGTSIYTENFDALDGWAVNPAGTDTASRGRWEAGVPEPTQYQGIAMQPAGAASGNTALLTGRQAGSSVGAFDLDDGVTSIRSPAINLPAGNAYTLQLDYYLAHLWNASAADYLRIQVENAAGVRQTLLDVRGNGNNRPVQWTNLTASLSEFAGSTIRLVVEAADGASGSIVEAGIDNIRIKTN